MGNGIEGDPMASNRAPRGRARQSRPLTGDSHRAGSRAISMTQTFTSTNVVSRGIGLGFHLGPLPKAQVWYEPQDQRAEQDKWDCLDGPTESRDHAVHKGGRAGPDDEGVSWRGDRQCSRQLVRQPLGQRRASDLHERIWWLLTVTLGLSDLQGRGRRSEGDPSSTGPGAS